MFCAYTRPRYQVSIYRAIGPLFFFCCFFLFVCFFVVFFFFFFGGGWPLRHNIEEEKLLKMNMYAFTRYRPVFHMTQSHKAENATGF